MLTDKFIGKFILTKTRQLQFQVGPLITFFYPVINKIIDNQDAIFRQVNNSNVLVDI